jgi:hypothetical protein
MTLQNKIARNWRIFGSHHPPFVDSVFEFAAEFLESSKLAAAFCHNPSRLRIKPQARKIFQTESDKSFRIDIDIATCVHGYLAPDKKQPASLIIFAVQFVCLAKR